MLTFNHIKFPLVIYFWSKLFQFQSAMMMGKMQLQLELMQEKVEEMEAEKQEMKSEIETIRAEKEQMQKKVDAIGQQQNSIRINQSDFEYRMKDKLDKAELRLAEKKMDEKINSSVLEQKEEMQKMKSEIGKINAERGEM